MPKVLSISKRYDSLAFYSPKYRKGQTWRSRGLHVSSLVDSRSKVCSTNNLLGRWSLETLVGEKSTIKETLSSKLYSGQLEIKILGNSRDAVKHALRVFPWGKWNSYLPTLINHSYRGASGGTDYPAVLAFLVQCLEARESLRQKVVCTDIWTLGWYA